MGRRVLVCLSIAVILPLTAAAEKPEDSRGTFLPAVTQPAESVNDSGIVSLAVICEMKGVPITLGQLGRMLSVAASEDGFAKLVEVAGKLDLKPQGTEARKDQFEGGDEPAIIELENGHYIVIVGRDRETGEFLLLDLPQKPLLKDLADVNGLSVKRWIAFKAGAPASTPAVVRAGNTTSLTVAPNPSFLGTVWQGDTAEGKVVIRNDSGTPVRILGVRQ
jgi:hypothetical protein